MVGPAAVEAQTGAAEAEVAVAQGTGNGARSDGGSGYEQVRRPRLGRIRARLGRGRRKLM